MTLVWSTQDERSHACCACGSRKLERPPILMVAASVPQTPPPIALHSWDTHLGATRANTTHPTRRSRIRPRPLPGPPFPAARDPRSQASTRGLPADCRSAEAVARGPDSLGLAISRLVRMARGAGDRQTRDGPGMETPEVPPVLGEAEPIREAWPTSGSW